MTRATEAEICWVSAISDINPLVLLFYSSLGDAWMNKGQNINYQIRHQRGKPQFTENDFGLISLIEPALILAAFYIHHTDERINGTFRQLDKGKVNGGICSNYCALQQLIKRSSLQHQNVGIYASRVSPSLYSWSILIPL